MRIMYRHHLVCRSCSGPLVRTRAPRRGRSTAASAEPPSLIARTIAMLATSMQLLSHRCCLSEVVLLCITSRLIVENHQMCPQDGPSLPLDRQLRRLQ